MVEGTESHTSTSLIRGAKANDASAWSRLVHTYGRRVYRWCRLAGLQSADASNVVQEVLRAVARSLNGFQHGRDGDTFRGWIRRITQNKIKDHFRMAGRQVESVAGGTDAFRLLSSVPTPDVDAENSGSSSTHQQQAMQAVERVKMMFSHRDWKIFWRVVVDGEDTKQVADEFEVTPNTVRIVKMRVSKQLQKEVPSPPASFTDPPN